MKLQCTVLLSSYKNIELFLDEKQRIEENFDRKILGGRQRMLRLNINKTFDLLENAKYRYDSSVGLMIQMLIGLELGSAYRPIYLKVEAQILR